MLTYRVRLFGNLKTYANTGVLELESPTPLTVGVLHSHLIEMLRKRGLSQNQIGLFLDSVLATDQEIFSNSESFSHSLESQDSLSLLPPVCGG